MRNRIDYFTCSQPKARESSKLVCFADGVASTYVMPYINVSRLLLHEVPEAREWPRRRTMDAFYIFPLSTICQCVEPDLHVIDDADLCQASQSEEALPDLDVYCTMTARQVSVLSTFSAVYQSGEHRSSHSRSVKA